MAWGYTQVFSGRAALLHLGAFTATIMSANVFFDHHPQPEDRGGRPDRRPQARPEIRQDRQAALTHNNYLTLPVMFLMLSNHYPLAFATRIQLAHRQPRLPDGRHDPALLQHDACPARATRTGPGRVTALIFIVIMAVDAPQRETEEEEEQCQALSAAQTFARTAQFRETWRASSCRAAVRCAMRPSRSGKACIWAPKGVMLETPAADCRRTPAKSICRPA
jgi:uncharacterized membrane protein